MVAKGKKLTLEVPVADNENGTKRFGMPTVTRDGVVHDWAKHVDVYHTVDGGDKPLLSLPRNQRVLEVNAGGYHFRGELKENGEYVWSESVSD